MGTWRRAYGALKDSTRIGLAKVSSEFKELDIGIVKATNHEECPPKDRHVRKIFRATSVARPWADIAYCIYALAKRLAKTRNWVIKDLVNQLVEGKKARSQLTFANETSRSFQPSFKQRPPLARITNRLPPLAPPHKIVKTGLENMENAHSTIKDVTQGFTTKPLGRARRISLSPVVFNISKNKRRASCATELETLAQLSEKHHMNHARVTTKPSQLRIIPRRRSVATLTPLQVTPEDKGKCISSFKYPSTSQLQTLWKSKIPSLPSPLQQKQIQSRFPNFPSPSQQNQIFSSGAGNSAQHLNKLCYSI